VGRAYGAWPEQGIVNPCRGALPPRLADHEIVQAAWSGIDAGNVWDCHAHLAGTGDSGSGIWVNPETQSVLHPLQYAQRLFYLNAGCASDKPGRIDHSYVERMHDLIDGMKPGFKLLLLAFDYSYREDAAVSFVLIFHTLNVLRLAGRSYPGYFEWAAPHPYRSDQVAPERQNAMARALSTYAGGDGIDQPRSAATRFTPRSRRSVCR
jgi:mannonate dehydratase